MSSLVRESKMLWQLYLEVCTHSDAKWNMRFSVLAETDWQNALVSCIRCKIILPYLLVLSICLNLFLGKFNPPPPLYLVLCVLLLTLGNQPVVLCNHFFAADSCIELLVWCNLLMHALKCTTEYHYYMQVDFSFMHYMHHPSSASQLWMINSHEFWCIMPI